jgi:DNA-directed RNA polymerase subunit M/transcription elongation factor TFIIS
MAISNNPLRQYFRRPAIYIKLPSGGQGYPAGTLELSETGELPVYPMTAIDEITVKTPDALFSGSAVPDLIKSCIPGIKDPWSMSSVDLDAILIAIRIATDNGKLELESECPSCEESSKYEVNLMAMLTAIKSGDYATEMSLGDMQIKFKPLNYRQINEVNTIQFDIQRLFNNIADITDETERTTKTKEAIIRITEATMGALAKTIEYIRIPSAIVQEEAFILDFLRNCDKAMFEEIKNHNLQLKEANTIKPIAIKCINCGHDYTQPFTLNMTDFFE